MDDLTPEQIAGVQQIRKERIAASRATHGEQFTRADIEAMMDKAEHQNEKEANAETLSFPRTLQMWLKRIVVGTGVAFAALLITFFLRPESISLTAPRRIERGNEFSFPTNLVLKLKKGRAEFFEADTRLTGEIRATNSAFSVTAYTLILAGADRDGVRAHFQGVLWLTNAPGKIPIKKASDILAVSIQGVLEVSGQFTNKVEQTFHP